MAGGLFSVALSVRLPCPGVTRHRCFAESGLSSPLQVRPSSLPRLAALPAPARRVNPQDRSKSARLIADPRTPRIARQDETARAPQGAPFNSVNRPASVSARPAAAEATRAAPQQPFPAVQAAVNAPHRQSHSAWHLESAQPKMYGASKARSRLEHHK